MVQMQSDLPPPGTDNIREQHAWLFERFEAYRDKTPGDRALRSEILAQFDRLLENMKHFYRKVESAEEYNWLISATYQWQVAFTSVFQIPRNIREEIGIPLQFPDLEPARKIVQSDEVAKYLSSKAYKIGQSRKLTAMSRLLAHLESHPHQIHSVIASSPDEMQDDWYGAMTCLTAEILDGRGDFARQLGSDLYRLLGDVWLDDVKRVKAYLIWESNGANWDPTGWTRNFILACEDVNRRTLEEGVKASPKTFAHVKTYLEKRYLVAGVVDLSHRPDAHHLIANKAQRIWERSGQSDDALTHWHTAERYVRLFYENISGAILQGDPDRVAAVIEGLHISQDKRHAFSIANCLEACLVTYYLRPAALKQVSAACQDLL